ncbi:hypothetical protein PAXRUDRAFT_128522 [Paxillus rubicundulus Ve08.2h10]|uniref:Uncharacterized protein n=1 Tax=Paxillus rubicundulus Ve08.2h10 TaxID=930991 RepID=A0A0D0EDF0_9AGAM|nr:hypothetical protein PAXRUDRAFT_128522 [Paxillus rubicundulus Ve08.2h10]
MLARLARRSARWFNLRVERVLSSFEDEETFSVDLSLASFVLPPDLSWNGVKGLCGRSVAPVYRGLKSVVEEDIEHVSRLLSELAPPVEETEGKAEAATIEAVSPIPAEPAAASRIFSSPDFIHPERVQRKRRRSSVLLDPIVIRPSYPSAPSIIITPCLSRARETSCWVPYQDASFGTHLTMPMHNALNSVHPPLVAPIDTAMTQIDNWEYTDGHWRATLPPPDEQCKKGMYSMVVISRRGRHCARSRTHS